MTKSAFRFGELELAETVRARKKAGFREHLSARRTPRDVAKRPQEGKRGLPCDFYDFSISQPAIRVDSLSAATPHCLSDKFGDTNVQRAWGLLHHWGLCPSGQQSGGPGGGPTPTGDRKGHSAADGHAGPGAAPLEQHGEGGGVAALRPGGSSSPGTERWAFAFDPFATFASSEHLAMTWPPWIPWLIAGLFGLGIVIQMCTREIRLNRASRLCKECDNPGRFWLFVLAEIIVILAAIAVGLGLIH